MRHVSEGAVKTGSRAPGLGRDIQPRLKTCRKRKNGNNQSTYSDLGRYGTGTKGALRVRCFVSGIGLESG
jgi:hypothetical protein